MKAGRCVTHIFNHPIMATIASPTTPTSDIQRSTSNDSMSVEQYHRTAEAAVCDILQLPLDTAGKYWDVINSIMDRNLVLVHYKADKIEDLLRSVELSAEQKQSILNLRGVVVDIVDRVTCCKSFGYTPTISMSKIPSTPFSQVDNAGMTVLIDPTDSSTHFQTCNGGSVIRLWKYKNIVYASSHRRIITTESRWGSSKAFAELIVERFPWRQYSKVEKSLESIGNIVFDKLTPTSNVCHVFLISHPDLMMDSLVDVGDGFLVYLRSFDLNPVDDSIPGIEWVSRWSHESYFAAVESVDQDTGDSYVPRFPSPLGEPHAIFLPSEVDLEIANEILNIGYSMLSLGDLDHEFDDRLYPGESVICFYEGTMCKIVPKCVNWRAVVLGNNPNFLNQFYQLLDYSYVQFKETDGPIFDGKQRSYSFEDLFPPIGTPSTREMAEAMSQLHIGQIGLYGRIGRDRKPTVYPMGVVDGVARDGTIQDNRLRNIAYNFMFAVPRHAQHIASTFYQTLCSQRDNLIELISREDAKLIAAIKNKTLVDDERFGHGGLLNPAGKAISRIVLQSHKHVATLRASHSDIDHRTGRKLKDSQLVFNNMSNLIRKEFGRTLYSMVHATTRPPRVKHDQPAAQADATVAAQ